MNTAAHIRTIKALQDMGISRLEHGIVACFLLDNRPWSISALAGSTGYTRAAIRNCLQKESCAVWVHRVPNAGYVLTEAGIAFWGRAMQMIEAISDNQYVP